MTNNTDNWTPKGSVYAVWENGWFNVFTDDRTAQLVDVGTLIEGLESGEITELNLGSEFDAQKFSEESKFYEWMIELDRLFQEKYSISIHDLEDYPYQDWFEAGMNADEAIDQLCDEGALDGIDMD